MGAWTITWREEGFERGWNLDRDRRIRVIELRSSVASSLVATSGGRSTALAGAYHPAWAQEAK